MGTYAFEKIPGIHSQAEEVLKRLMGQLNTDILSAVVFPLTISTTPHHTATVSSASDTSIWKLFTIPGIFNVWFIRTTALAASLDDDGALDDATVFAAEVLEGDFFLVQANVGGGTYETGFMTARDPSTGVVDLSNITSIGLADTD